VIPGRIALLIPQVVGQFGAHGSFQQRLRQLLHKSILTNHILGFLIALQQFVKQFFLDFHFSVLLI
jgi:hypothetical protein